MYLVFRNASSYNFKMIFSELFYLYFFTYNR